MREAAFLDIRKPKVIKVDELPGFDTVRDAAKFREGLQAQGYDGIVIHARHLGKTEVHFVAFHPDQVVMHDEPAFSRKREGDTISTRNPTGKRSTEDALTHQLSIGLEALQRDPEGFAHNVGLATSYPGYRNEGARTPAQKAERFIRHVTANLLWLHDSMTPELRARSKLWYEGANKIAKQFARDYKVSTRQSAGMLAALSPQKDWFQNVSLAKRVAETMAQHQNTPWTPEMTATAERLASGQSRTLKAQPQVEKLNSHLTKLFDAIKGKTLGELSDSLIEQAAWVRVFDETHNARSYPVVTPEGDFEGLSLNSDGSATKVAWGDYRTIGNAISIYRNGSIENISNTLGTEHKVRSFYNNIIDPQSEEGHVTIDTHAVAAALVRPLSGGSREVLHNFGNNITGEPGPASSKVNGTSGLYGLYAEAYRRAAEERGLLPREMQSITWEAVRGLFSPEFKRAEQKRAEANGARRKADRVATADQIWKDYTDGKLTLEQARSQVHDLAGGISVPEWAGGRPAGEVDEAEGRAGDAGELPADRVPGGPTEAVDGGAGSAAAEGAAAAVPGEVSFARKPLREYQQHLKDGLESVLHSKKTTSLWDRSVGTMSNLARKSPEFRKVYDKANDFIHDISYFASTSAEQAPTLLPRLDGIRSLGKGLGKTITGERTADIKAAANLAYQGTLDKKVHTPEELARRGVKASVIKMYQEARAAVDMSLEQTGTSIMARMARTLGLDVGNVREMGMQEARSKIVDALRAQRDALRPLLENERQLLSLKAEEFSKQLTPEALHQTLKNATEKVDALQRKYDEAVKSIDDVNDVAGRVVDLQNEGYFPLMRFGKYTIYATQKVNGKTEQLYFGMFESEKKRIEMERALRATYPNADIVPGVANDNVDRLFKGVNLDSLEVFAKALGADEEDVFQQYLKLAVANRSAIKRMIERKEVPGFSTDMTRTLSSFLTSNARMASRNYHWADAKAAALAIPKEKGDLQKAAVNLLDYIEHPNEEGQLPRALNFTWYILGNISSAAVNLTQPAMTTFPTLSKWGAKEATAAMGKAAALLSNRTKMDPDLRAALKRAEEQGVVEPHEIHYLYGEQQRHFLSGDTRAGAIAARAQRALGEAFALAESVNRHLTFVAGYLRARDMTPEQLTKEGVTDPFDYAMKLVDRTQFVYNKANRPQWARGTIQSLLFQFKTYSISSIELFHQLTREGPEGKKAAGIMLAVWMLAAGYAGLPFEKNIEDMVDTVGQLLGYDTNARAFMRDHMQAAALKLLGEHLGPVMEDVLAHGVSHLGPLDLSNRLGFGDLIPATSLGKRSETGNRTKDALELLGPTGATVQALLNKMDAFENDKDTPNGTVPGFIGNVMQAVDMARTGLYRDDKGKTVAAITPTDVAVKALGFTPTDVQREQERMATINQSVMLSKTVQEAYTQRIAMALADAQLLGTPKADAEASKTVDDILREVERWNERNPDTPVALQNSAIEGAVKQMILTREVRELKTAPRAMKGIIASQLLSEEH